MDYEAIYLTSLLFGTQSVFEVQIEKKSKPKRKGEILKCSIIVVHRGSEPQGCAPSCMWS